MSKHVFGHYDTAEEAKHAVDSLIASGHKRENITVYANHKLGPSFTKFYTYELVDPHHIEGWDAAAMRSHASHPRKNPYEVSMSPWMRLRDAAVYDRHQGSKFRKQLKKEEEEIFFTYSKAVSMGEILVVVDHPDPPKCE